MKTHSQSLKNTLSPSVKSACGITGTQCDLISHIRLIHHPHTRLYLSGEILYFFLFREERERVKVKKKTFEAADF